MEKKKKAKEQPKGILGNWIVGNLLLAVLLIVYMIKRGNLWGVCGLHAMWDIGLHLLFDFIEEGTTIWIEDYGLDNNFFSGIIRDGRNRVEFELYHVSSPNWYDYEWGWDYYYAKPSDLTRAASGDAENHEVMPKRFIRTEK